MKTFFTSDLHLNHLKIIQYVNRPFSDVVEMNEKIIDNWNSKIGKKDLVYHLGDLGFFKKYEDCERMVQRLNGKIINVKGNHDNYKIIRPIPLKLELMPTYLEIRINGVDITMCHYALRTWSKKHYGSSYMISGHSHATDIELNKDFVGLGKILDVGVDGNNFYPYEWDEIVEIMKNK
jgi:calcineurin-like phosphoesterase family protein